ncbi:HAD-IA family hydrolase [Corynebacterium cystitidis]|uniref:HAD-IA family hydrolase n=1 Tax=Corynebacterium cystitidis TaxID=35757 RepID=UPI00211E578F|nr:HAD-IA family hydrolase [Corynebacterium cystitidis]
MTALLFGLYGVLMEDRTAEGCRRMETAAGVTNIDRMWAAYHHLRPAYEVGTYSAHHWWEDVAVRARAPELDIEAAITADWETMMNPVYQTVDTALKLHDAGYTCGVLGNLPLCIAERLRDSQEWLAEFDAVIFSCDLGVRQPDPRAYAVAVDALGSTASDTIFFDGNPTHVAAAEAAGLRARLYTGPNDITELGE